MNDTFDFDSDMDDSFDDQLYDDDPVINEDPFIGTTHNYYSPDHEDIGILENGFEKELDKIESAFKEGDISENGFVNSEGVISLESTIDYSKFDINGNENVHDGSQEINQYKIILGNPEVDIRNWHMQVMPDSCAIVSQEYILEEFTGREFSEFELVEHAIKNGYYLPGSGTLPIDVGNILEDYGIEIERTSYNTTSDIFEKLQNGQKVIVGLDANEIWRNSEFEQLQDLFFMPEANHAVEVIGYNSDSNAFILNDPGHPNGKGMEVSALDFELAWNDSNNFMMFTKDPAPGHAIA